VGGNGSATHSYGSSANWRIASETLPIA
jgi:hypothetical protein